ncbi:hypothetical protein [Leptothrix ochracea]|uniref:hypothetical protein n=1 Tax=Leptothrix ochracea TaxID=735331 RepID=UPI0034E2EA8B
MNTIVLRPVTFHWVHGDEDDPLDQCAHGRIEFVINGQSFVNPDTGPWSLSLAALYFLRCTIDQHIFGDDLTESNFLVPCCGHNPWLVGEGKYKLMCMGCNDGVDIEVLHRGSETVLRDKSGHEEAVFRRQWISAVLHFVAEVEDFYRRCSPKADVCDEKLDQPGWIAFWEEWKSLKLLAQNVA